MVILQFMCRILYNRGKAKAMRALEICLYNRIFYNIEFFIIEVQMVAKECVIRNLIILQLIPYISGNNLIVSHDGLMVNN